VAFPKRYNPQNPSPSPSPSHLEPSSQTAEVWTALRQEARLYAIATRVAQRFARFEDPNCRTPAEETLASGLPDGDPSSCPPAYPSWVSEWVNRPLAALEAYRAGKLSHAQTSAIREAVSKYHGDLLTVDLARAPQLPSEIPDPPKGTYVSPNFGGDAIMARSVKNMLARHPEVESRAGKAYLTPDR
jgi:hypothetical protein